MQRFFFIILINFISVIASAKCANNGIYILSTSPALNKNGLIILEFYASSQSLIPDLNKKYAIYLQSGKNKIKLLVTEILKGEFQLTQVVLKPNSELLENETYTLFIDNLPKFEKNPGRYNEQAHKLENLTFKISAIDIDAPILENSITESKKTIEHFGCGPEEWVYFNIAGQDKSELFVRASVKNKSTGKTTDYILPIKNGQVKIGHGMCSGAFYFDPDDEYEVTFLLFDQSGNINKPAKTISFDSPTNQNASSEQE